MDCVDTPWGHDPNRPLPTQEELDTLIREDNESFLRFARVITLRFKESQDKLSLEHT